MKPPFARAALAALVTAWPAVAVADPMCESPFVSPGCFLTTCVAVAIFAAPLGLLGALAVFLLGRRRAPARGSATALAALGAIAVALAALFAMFSAAPKAHPGVHMLVAAAVTAAYAALALRRLGLAPWRASELGGGGAGSTPARR